jgi:hypothetical protein
MAHNLELREAVACLGLLVAVVDRPDCRTVPPGQVHTALRQVEEGSPSLVGSSRFECAAHMDLLVEVRTSLVGCMCRRTDHGHTALVRLKDC